MTVLLFLIIFLMSIYEVIGKKNKKIYCVIVFVCLTLVATLRSYQVGPDGVVYANYFKQLQEMEFSNIAVYFTKEPIFYYVTKILQNLGVGLQGWYGIIGGGFAIAISLIIYFYSELPVYSVLALMSLGYYVFSFTGLRQTVALSIVVLSAIFLEKRKYIFFIVSVVIAMFFHNSAIIFLIMLPFHFIHLSRKQYAMVSLVGFVSVILFRGKAYNIIYSIIERTIRFDGYSGYSYGLSWMGYVIQVSIFLFALYCMDDEAFIDNKFFFDLSFLGVFFQLFSALMAEMFRISMYFSIFNIILIANTCASNKFTEESKKIIKLIIMIMLLYYFIHSHINYQYYFYW